MKKWSNSRQVPLGSVSRPLHFSTIEKILNMGKNKREIRKIKYTQKMHEEIVKKTIEKQSNKENLIIEQPIRVKTKKNKSVKRTPDILDRKNKKIIEIKTVPFLGDWDKDEIVQRFPGRIWRAWDYLQKFPKFKSIEIIFHSRRREGQREIHVEYTRDELNQYGFEELWGDAEQRKKKLFEKVQTLDLTIDPIVYFYKAYKNKRVYKYMSKNEKNINRTNKLTIIANQGNVFAIKIYHDREQRRTIPVTKDGYVVMISLMNGRIFRNNEIRFVNGEFDGELKIKPRKKIKFSRDEIIEMIHKHEFDFSGNREIFLYPGKYWLFWQIGKHIEHSVITIFPTESKTLVLSKEQEQIYTSDDKTIINSIEKSIVIFNNIDEIREIVRENVVEKLQDQINKELIIDYVFNRMTGAERRKIVGIQFGKAPDRHLPIIRELEERIFNHKDLPILIDEPDQMIKKEGLRTKALMDE